MYWDFIYHKNYRKSDMTKKNTTPPMPKNFNQNLSNTRTSKTELPTQSNLSNSKLIKSSGPRMTFDSLDGESIPKK